MLFNKPPGKIVTTHYIYITFSLRMEYWAIFYAQFNKNFKLASLKQKFFKLNSAKNYYLFHMRSKIMQT